MKFKYNEDSIFDGLTNLIIADVRDHTGARQAVAELVAQANAGAELREALQAVWDSPQTRLGLRLQKQVEAALAKAKEKN